MTTDLESFPVPDTTLFFRLLAAGDKAAALADAVDSVREGRGPVPSVHQADPQSFRQIPGSPFAYWVGEAIRRKFVELPPFEGEGRTVRLGLSTKNDARFVRLFWEVAPSGLGRNNN